MNSSEVVETSDDDELELKLLETTTNQTTSHRAGQSPRKRRKLYHDFEPDIPRPGTPVRASSVTWPPTSSSPNTSPKSSSLLQTPPHDLLHPKLSPKHNEPDDGLPPVFSSSFLPTFDEVELPDIHASLGMIPSPTPRPLDQLPTVSLSPPDVINTNDEPLNVHERLLSSTPPPSSPELRLRSPSLDPMLLFDIPPLRPTGSVDQETLLDKDQRPQDLFLRRDVSPHIDSQSALPVMLSLDNQALLASPRQHMSPSTPIPAQHSPQILLPHNSSIISSDRSLQARIVQVGEPDVTHLVGVDIPSISRYPLRKRAPAQLKPYTVEKYHYKQALSANPDAIVNIRDPGRVSHDHYDHTDGHFDESQAPWQPSEEIQGDNDDERWYLRTKASHHDDSHDIIRPTPEGRPVQYDSELLQDLPSSDDEESKSMQRFSKEAKRLERKRRKVRLEEERLVRQKSEGAKAHTKPKPFPVKRPSRCTSRSRSLSISPDASLPSPSRSTTRWDTSRSRSQVVLLSPIPDTSTQISFPTSPPHSCSSPYYIDHDEADNLDARMGTGGFVGLSDPETQSEHDSEGDGEDIPSGRLKRLKGEKTLRRMYPRFMINKLLSGSLEAFKPKSRAKRHTEDLSGSENEETAVLPGRSRSGWSDRPWNKEIKGDTESSDDQHASDLEFPSDNDSVQMQSGFRTRSNRQDTNDVMDLTVNLEEDPDDEEDEEDGDDDDGVYDWEIEAYLAGNTEPKAEQAPSAGRMREGSLIDWMLTKTRTIGGPSRPRTRKRPLDRVRNPKRARSSGYKVDVMIRGRRERQTRLNFDGHTRKKTTNQKSQKGNHAPRRARSGSVHEEANDEHDRVQPVTEPGAPLPKKDRKQREREWRARAKGNGLHIFTSDSIHLVSGRRKRALMTIDVEEDDGFSQAIAPLSQDQPKPLQSARIVNTNYKEPVSEQRLSPNRQQDVHKVRTQPHPLRLDCGIEVLQSGLSFSANSYIRKGWLHELVSVIRGEQPPPLPTKIIFHGIEIGPDSSVDDLINSLKQVFDELFDIVTSLLGAPDIDEEMEWRRVRRAVNQSLSLFLASATEAATELLRNTVQEQVSTFVSRMRSQSFNSSSLDTFTLTICWFAVEISARLDLPTKIPTSSTILGQSVSLLMNHLWSYGVESVMTSLKEGSLPDDSTAQYVAELWVSLFHLLDLRQNMPDDSFKKAVHPFSFLLQETLESIPRPLKHPLKASEWVWHSIFSLCALTQFSVHGMTTSASRLPASWELIVYALKQVRLTVDADGALSQQSLQKRDMYTRWITERCFLLRSRWHWQLDDIINVLSYFSKVFQTRSFAGLRHELQKPDYPFFLLHNDWSVFEKLEPGDTAFVVFLKLLFQAVGCNETSAPHPLSPKAKKMLSMAIPVTKLPFSKKIPTAIQDLSMLYNRLSAVAVAIHLDPTSHAQRMRTARSYVDFSDADDTTRCAVIRGMIYLAIMLKKARLPTDSINHWAGEMAITLANEYKAPGENPSAGTETDRKLTSSPHISVELLVGAVRQIFQAYQADSGYPDLALLEALDPIFKVANLTDQPTTAEQIRQMLQVFIDARKGALPPSERPRRNPTTRDSQESQDDYPTMDIDYDDPKLLAALDARGAEVPSPEVIEFTEKEEKLNAYMSSVFWCVWRNLNKRVTNFASLANGDYICVESWLECWLGCVDVMVHAGHNTKSWQRYLTMRENWKQLPEPMRKCLDFSIMKRLLKIDPMTYSDYRNMYLEALLTALVSTDPTNERDFIRLVLDVDGGQHPLLVGISIEELTDHPNEQESYDILPSLIENLASRYADMTTSSDEREGLIDICIIIFQAMKRNSLRALRKGKGITLDAEILHKRFRAIENCAMNGYHPGKIGNESWIES
ncbi:hypothetical protein C0995_009513 [Termitomyces sp. Mi166|nr:hypothetical protein C0995_009513 [Termitomyces sp. Mi166\